VQGQIRELVAEKGRLESEVAAAERKTKNVEAKLKRAETSILKLRLEVAAVLQADYELTERHKALLAEAVGTGYGQHESGKRLLRTHPHLCLHARPMPTLACTHPRLRLHACNHARARMHAPTPSLACAYPR